VKTAKRERISEAEAKETTTVGEMKDKEEEEGKTQRRAGLSL